MEVECNDDTDTPEAANPQEGSSDPSTSAKECLEEPMEVDNDTEQIKEAESAEAVSNVTPERSDTAETTKDVEDEIFTELLADDVTNKVDAENKDATSPKESDDDSKTEEKIEDENTERSADTDAVEEKDEMDKEKNDEMEKEENDEIDKEKNDEIDKEKNDEMDKENNDEMDKEKNHEMEKEMNDELEKEKNDEMEKEKNDEMDKEKNDEMDKEKNDEKDKETIDEMDNNEKETAEEITATGERNPLEDDKIDRMDADDSNSEMKTESTDAIAEVSMEELSSEAPMPDEGADPMPEGDEATITEKDSLDAQPDADVEFTEPEGDMHAAPEPDVSGVEQLTIEEESETPKESKSTDDGELKYVITHHNSSEDERCCVCLQVCAAKYMAKNDTETVFICLNDCLSRFKEMHRDNYIEKILRLRAFAIQEKPDEEEEDGTAEEEFECENDDEKSNSDRKCSFCSLAIVPEMHLSWEAMDYCNEGCLLNYQRTMNSNCGMCNTSIAENVIGKYCVRFGMVITQFCSTGCIIAYKRTGSYFCAFCQHEMNARTAEFKNFCSKRCMDTCQPQMGAKESGTCAVCHNVKLVEIKIKMEDKVENICGEMCCLAYKFVNKIQPVKCQACITQFDPERGGNLVVYLNNKLHTVCSEECQKILLLMNRKIISCKMCLIKKYDFDMVKVHDGRPNIKFTCSNACMKVYLDQKFQEFVKNVEVNTKQLENCIKDTDLKINKQNIAEYLKGNGYEMKTPVHRIILTKPRPGVKQRNMSTMCKPFGKMMLHKVISAKPDVQSKNVQTDVAIDRCYVPVPMPIHVPTPVHMFAQNVPFLVPVPMPLPVPIFVPTGRKSISGIAKEIQKIKNRMPTDPLEAEILMMAERAAGDKKEETSSESETEEVYKEEPTTTEPMEASTSEQPYTEDIVSVPLKVSSSCEEPPATEPSTSDADPTSRIESIMDAKRKNIRQAIKAKSRRSEPQPEPDLTNADSNLSLKYTFGVNAWKQWVTIKNAELQKTQKRPVLFKPDILQLSTDDLNASLCLFVKEVRKPSGAEYAPDTIYYLCLGIQQYLYENARVDNIFCDAFYDKFTETFNDVCVKFSNLYNETQFIVTRVEEEHLWESKQLGAHSPLVLLNTLMFFNTKHFSLTNVAEHFQLSFSHIMKHWKRNTSAPGCRSVLLRFYPPMSADGKKKKVYEQLENDTNPLRCPVKLYEFYLSKCPESVKTRNDVFYLLPERSCVPDSPVWYSTMAMDKEPLEKMLNRIKMVKEINVALLTA